MPPPGECRATVIRPTIRITRSSTDRVSAHAIRHADDGLGTIHDLQAHRPTAVPLPRSSRCARSCLAPQRTGSVEPVTPSGITLSGRFLPLPNQHLVGIGGDDWLTFRSEPTFNFHLGCPGTSMDPTGQETLDLQRKRASTGSWWTPLDVEMVELGGFEPPSASLFRTVLHV